MIGGILRRRRIVGLGLRHLGGDRSAAATLYPALDLFLPKSHVELRFAGAEKDVGNFVGADPAGEGRAGDREQDTHLLHSQQRLHVADLRGEDGLHG